MPQRGTARAAAALCLVAASGLTPPPAATAGGALAESLRPGGEHLTYEFDLAVEGPLLRPLARDAARTARGEALFHKDWLDPGAPYPAARPLAGPHHDRSACPACHLEARREGLRTPPRAVHLVARPAHATDRRRFGVQVTTRSLPPHLAEARVEIDYRHHLVRYADGQQRRLRKPVARAVDSAGRAFDVNLRAAPLLFGWGLLENVDRTMIAHFDDPEDRNGDGISGRRPLVPDARTGGLRPGLFGWKMAHPTLEQQIAAALAHDMGVTSPATCSPACPPEIDRQALAALTEYVRHLGVPDQRRGAGDPAMAQGEKLFGTSGCSACHVPVVLTRRGGGYPFSEQMVWAYTDLMLHDMGDRLADAGDAPEGREWRTAPLWGIGLVEALLPAHGFLHDGRARSIEEAILWHGGEAARSRQRFMRLSAGQRRALLVFVRAL